MGDIELVIKISKEDYERLKEYKKAPFCSLTSRAYEAIANGTPLPKGHGRLIDESKITSCEWDVFLQTMITNAPAIIEADIDIK